MTEYGEAVDGAAAETGFSGVVRVERDGELLLERAYGLADRAHGVAMTPDTRIGIASGSKTFTALAVLTLAEQGVLPLGTRARELLGADLPLVDDAVTVQQLLAHRSGIGDYLDEDEIEDDEAYVLGRPVHELDSTEAFLPLLDGHPQKFPPGERFAYCNGGFVVLALLAERASGVGYHDLVRQRVLEPAGLTRTAFLRSDELPGDAATGYVRTGDAWRSNVFHLPVLATGDGGLHTTAADVHLLWAAALGGRIVSPETVAEMTRPHSDVPEEHARYGLGIWLRDTTDELIMLGGDAGASFQSSHDRDAALTWSVLSNTTSGAWPVAKALREASTS